MELGSWWVLNYKSNTMKNTKYTALLLLLMPLFAHSQMEQIKAFLERPEVKFVKEEFIKSTWHIEGGIGGNLQLVPSRLNYNEYNANVSSNETIKNALGVAPGLALALQIQPIQNKFVAYQYQVKYSEAWFFPMSASSKWSSHHIALGYDYLFFTMHFEQNKLSYTYSDVGLGTSIEKTEEKSNSIYESNANSYGVQWIINREKLRSLEFRRINKKFSNFSANAAVGYGLYFANKRNMIQLEYIPKHTIQADSYVKDNIFKAANLENTSSYFHFSFIKYFGFGSAYTNTRKKMLYF